MNIEEMFNKENPPSTKFLVELEVVDEDGYSRVVSNTVVNDLINKFTELTGCKINRIYKKDIEVENNTNIDLEAILIKALERVQNLKNQGLLT